MPEVISLILTVPWKFVTARERFAGGCRRWRNSPASLRQISVLPEVALPESSIDRFWSSRPRTRPRWSQSQGRILRNRHIQDSGWALMSWTRRLSRYPAYRAEKIMENSVTSVKDAQNVAPTCEMRLNRAEWMCLASASPRIPSFCPIHQRDQFQIKSCSELVPV